MVNSVSMLFELLLVFIVSWSLTFVFAKIGTRFNIFSQASYRRKDTARVPLFGGLALFIATALGFLHSSSDYTLTLLVCFVPLLVMGFLDDVYEIGGKWKLGAQAVSSIAWVLYAHSIEGTILSNSLGPAFIAIPLAILFLIGMTNAFNLVDGLDGQAAGFAVTNWMALAFCLADSQFALIPAAAVAGFAMRNLPPAKIYLGEIGSSFLGFSLAAIAMILPVNSPNALHAVGLLILFAIPLLDTCCAIFRRMNSGRSVYQGDREHIHHRLLKLRFTRLQSLLISNAMVVTVSLAFVLWWHMDSGVLRAGLLTIIIGFLLLTFMAVFYIEKRFSANIVEFADNLIEMRRAIFNGNPIQIVQTDSTEQTGGRGLAINLIPYLREAQEADVKVLINFLGELPEFIHSLHRGEVTRFHEASSQIVILFSDSSRWEKYEIEAISASLYELLNKYRLTRSNSRVPEGLTFIDCEKLPKFLNGIFVRREGHKLGRVKSAS